MARYSLILKDSTYVSLVRIAQAQGLSLGKYINDSLNRIAEDPKQKEDKRVCFVCGEKPKIAVDGVSGTIFLCVAHQKFKQVGRGYREFEVASL